MWPAHQQKFVPQNTVTKEQHVLLSRLTEETEEIQLSVISTTTHVACHQWEILQHKTVAVPAVYPELEITVLGESTQVSHALPKPQAHEYKTAVTWF